MTQAPSRNLSSVLKRPLDQHHPGCINLGRSVLVPYQLSASSYTTVVMSWYAGIVVNHRVELSSSIVIRI